MTKPVYIFGGAIGDALIGIQLWRCLDAAHKGATLTVISTRAQNSFVKELLSLFPGIEFLELPKSSLRSWLTLLRLAGAPHMLVYLEPFHNKAPLWWRLLGRVLTLRAGSMELHCTVDTRAASGRIQLVRYDCRTDSLFDLPAQVVRAWGFDLLEPPRPHLEVSEKATAVPYLLFHFFAASTRRTWPYEKARPLLRAARDTFPQYEFVLTCAPHEEPAARRLAEGIDGVRIVSGAPAREVVALLAGARLRIGVASGIMHIASHLPVRSILLCNLSDPCWLPRFNPQAILLSAPEHCACKGDKTGDCSVMTQEGEVYRCLYDIPIERVLEEMHL